MLLVINTAVEWGQIIASSVVRKAAFPEKVQELCGFRVLAISDGEKPLPANPEEFFLFKGIPVL